MKLKKEDKKFLTINVAEVLIEIIGHNQIEAEEKKWHERNDKSEMVTRI